MLCLQYTVISAPFGLTSSECCYTHFVWNSQCKFLQTCLANVTLASCSTSSLTDCTINNFAENAHEYSLVTLYNALEGALRVFFSLDHSPVPGHHGGLTEL